MTHTAVFWFDSALPERARNELSAALATAGVRRAPPGASAYACVFFASLRTEVVDVVARLAAGQPGRLVAIAAGPDEVEEEGAWRLMAAGAADVFAWRHSDTG